MRTELIHKLLCGPVALFITLAASGCGKSIVKDASVSSFVQSGDQYGEVVVDLDMGSLQLPDVSLPIFNPMSPGVSYGQLTLASQQITVDLDLTVIAKLPSGDATLPNGTRVPVSAAAQSKLLSIAIPGTRFVIYTAIQIDAQNPGAAPVAMVGVALPFSQFDSLGRATGNADLFETFNLPKGIQGTAGIFTGSQPGTSGLGLFVDVSGLIQQVAPPQPAAPAMLSALMLRAPVAAPVIDAQPAAPLQYRDVTPGGSRDRRIRNTLYRMSRGTQLTLD